MNDAATDALAINGGQKAVSEWPPRRLFGLAEKAAVDALFEKGMAEGVDFGYNGTEETAYCAEFAEFMGGGYADAVSSGTAAVYVALRALELEPFTEVICPCVTDPGGVMPIPLCNCIPIPADAAPGGYNVGVDQIEARLTPRTSAIVVAHIAGTPVDMDPVMELANAHDIPVIEDAAQAHGARYKGRLVGTLGTIASFSTMFGKHHATGGQGGVVFTQDEDLYWRVRRYSDRGKGYNIENNQGNVVASLNLNLDDLRGCIGRVQLKKLPAIVEARRAFALALAEGCKPLQTVSVEVGPEDMQSSFWFIFMKLDIRKLRVDKATFIEAIRAEGLLADSSYLHLFASHDWYRNRAVFGSSGLPWTAPQYGGDPDVDYPTPNVIAADAEHFRLLTHERIGVEMVPQVVEAFRKVEAAYLK